MDKFVFFWSGPFSNWFKSPFEYDEVRYSCGEQGMMAVKARHFKDNDTLKKIMKTSSPREQKALGREVKNFDEGEWEKVREEYVFQISLAKYEQNPELKQLLVETGDKMLVEASPHDRIWGIGLPADDPRALDIDQWRGLNLLGKCLMRVRGELKK